MQFPMLQIVIIAKTHRSEHFYLRVRLEKKKVRSKTLAVRKHNNLAKINNFDRTMSFDDSVD